MDDDVRALLSPEGEQQYLRQKEIDDFDLAELRRRRLELYPEPKAEPPQRTATMDKQNATATYVTWSQLHDFSGFLGAELGKAESRANAKIKALEADVAALKCDVEVLTKHKAAKSDVVPLMRGRDVA